jgi:hypothetical protein
MGKTDFLSTTHAQNGPRDHPTSYAMDTGALSRGYNGQGVIMTPPLLAQRLRMSGAIPLLPLLCLQGILQGDFTFNLLSDHSEL